MAADVRWMPVWTATPTRTATLAMIDSRATVETTFVGPDYATIDFRLGRTVGLGGRRKLHFLVESFNLLNRNNRRIATTDQGLVTMAAQFLSIDNRIGINYFPASYRRSTNFLRATDAYAPRQVQLAVRFTF